MVCLRVRVYQGREVMKEILYLQWLLLQILKSFTLASSKHCFSTCLYPYMCVQSWSTSHSCTLSPGQETKLNGVYCTNCLCNFRLKILSTGKLASCLILVWNTCTWLISFHYCWCWSAGRWNRWQGRYNSSFHGNYVYVNGSRMKIGRIGEVSCIGWQFCFAIIYSQCLRWCNYKEVDEARHTNLTCAHTAWTSTWWTVLTAMGWLSKPSMHVGEATFRLVLWTLTILGTLFRGR